MKLRNQPITKKQVQDLGLGLHLHSYPNRRNRRGKSKNSNNRKLTSGRLVVKQVVPSREYNEIINNLNIDATERRSLLYTGQGKLRSSMYKTIIRENRQITYNPLELKQIAESKERMKKFKEELDKKASSDAKGL